MHQCTCVNAHTCVCLYTPAMMEIEKKEHKVSLCMMERRGKHVVLTNMGRHMCQN